MLSKHADKARKKVFEQHDLWEILPAELPASSSALFNLFKQPECEGITWVHDQNIKYLTLSRFTASLSNNRVTTSEQNFFADYTPPPSSTNKSSILPVPCPVTHYSKLSTTVWRKHCHSWQMWSSTIIARATGCSDSHSPLTTTPNLRKQSSTQPFLKALSGLAFIKKLTWNPVS